MAQLFANNVSTTLASDITTSSTALSLKAGTGAQFPTIGTTSTDFMLITLVDKDGNTEIIKIIEHVGTTDTLTVGDSTAVPHAADVAGRAYEAIHGAQTKLAITASDNHAIKVCPTAGSMQTAMSFTAVTASTAEINSTCDGNTATAAELSELHSAGAVNADFVKLHALTESAALINAAADLLDPANRTVGDILTETSAGTMGAIAAGALNTHLKGAGAGSLPAWGKLALSDTGVKIGYFTITASGDVTVSGVGFSPSVVIFLAHYEAGGGGYSASIGFDDGTICCALECGRGLVVYGGVTHYAAFFYQSAYSISVTDGGECHASISSKNSDGFVVTGMVSAPGDAYVIYLALP